MAVQMPIKFIVLLMSMAALGLAASDTIGALEQDAQPQAIEVLEPWKEFIVQKHNELRASVQPPADGMETMTWDQDVADFAQEWVYCRDSFNQHRVNSKGYGESMERVSSSYPMTDIIPVLKFSLEHWWGEGLSYNYETTACALGVGQCGHYTQMAWYNSIRVGCAYILNCPMSDTQSNYTFFMVCNYSPGGNFAYIDPATGITHFMQPYKKKSVKVIDTWTYGGTAQGKNCSFPFTFKGVKYNDCTESIEGETAWCKTNDGTWGYCPPKAMRGKQRCVDKTSGCLRYVNMYMDGRCPSDTHETAYVDQMKEYCPATCGHCDCPVKQCQHGGTLDACVCSCHGGWIGGDCAVCPITKCKNGGMFDASTCRCKCQGKYGGIDCGCENNANTFSNRGRNWWRCSLTWLVTKRQCNSRLFGPSLRENCPVTCGSCVHPAFKSRQ